MGFELFDWAGVPATEVLPGIHRQRIDGEKQTVIRYVYAPGSVFPQHSHPEEQSTLVMSGVIEFTVDGEIATLARGHGAVIPGNVPHGARVIGNETVETFNILSPRRESGPVLR